MADGLWAPRRRALTGGLVLTITFVAAEALAVVTVMPVVARDLGGLALYGWAFSAFMLGTVIGIVAAGRQADRLGPAVPYIAGLVLFGGGLCLAGLAPTMPVLVAGRALQGIGGGALPALGYIAIGRCLPERLRARMMAVLSTAWVVPGLAGPAVSAEVARLFGWRWVFLGLLPIVAVSGSFAIPALIRIGRPPPAAPPAPEAGQPAATQPAAGAAQAGQAAAAQPAPVQPAPMPAAPVPATPVPATEAQPAPAQPAAGPAQAVGPAQAAGHRLIDGVLVALGAGLLLAGLTLVVRQGLAGAGLIVVGVAVGLPVLRRLLPAGAFTARRGLPATVLTRGILTFAFFGADAYVTLTITTVRQQSTVLAGVAVTGATLTWTAGAWVQARLNDTWEGRRMVRIGLVVILAGIAGMVLVVHRSIPVEVALAAWSVAGLGMGLGYAPTTLMMLREAPPGREGWASASLSLADVLGTALGIGVGGAAVTAAAGSRAALGAGVTIAFGVAAVAAVVGLAVTTRLPSTTSKPLPQPSKELVAP